MGAYALKKGINVIALLESQGQPKLFEGVNNFFPNVLLQLPPTI
jgi:hypothetical protein